jgi:hypothetical protein
VIGHDCRHYSEGDDQEQFVLTDAGSSDRSQEESADKDDSERQHRTNPAHRVEA